MGKRKVINPGWSYYPGLTFSPAVRKCNMLFISGQNAAQYDPAIGKPVIKGDIVSQTEVVYEKIDGILKTAGPTFNDILMTTDMKVEESMRRLQRHGDDAIRHG